MIDNNNIVLITDSDIIAKSVLAKLILLRENDKISVCSVHNAKSVIKNSIKNDTIFYNTFVIKSSVVCK